MWQNIYGVLYRDGTKKYGLCTPETNTPAPLLFNSVEDVRTSKDIEQKDGLWFCTCGTYRPFDEIELNARALTGEYDSFTFREDLTGKKTGVSWEEIVECVMPHAEWCAFIGLSCKKCRSLITPNHTYDWTPGYIGWISDDRSNELLEIFPELTQKS